MTAMDEPKAFTLDDISALAELPRRTVRYYIQSGLIDRPQGVGKGAYYTHCLLYTSDAADERSSVDLGGRRIIKKKKHIVQTWHNKQT